ncbi:RluA family pseudouridine synthase [Bacillus sp. FJAT-50079]|nr:RluA family pseudouridine synthase [Bacillus sp. FJAT-50079]
MKDKRYSLKWTIDRNKAGLSIKQFLADEGISQRALTDIKFAGGKITVNGMEQNVRYLLNEDEILEVMFPLEQTNESLRAEDLPLEIMYEDRDLLVINKQAGMSTIPSREHPNGNLANALVYYYKQNQIYAAVHIVTRLDRDTSGLVLIAKHRHAHHLLSIMQQQFRIDRSYEAFVTGKWREKYGTIDVPIGRKCDSIIEREVRIDGKRAVTHYSLLQQYNDFSHIKLNLETGRTHQIRVHMAYKNHPLIGDDLYGGDTTLMQRQALHCRELSFEHPIIKTKLTFIAPLSEDMQLLLN